MIKTFAIGFGIMVSIVAFLVPMYWLMNKALFGTEISGWWSLAWVLWLCFGSGIAYAVIFHEPSEKSKTEKANG